MTFRSKRSKYNAHKTICDGERFDSKAEADYFGLLNLLLRTKQIVGFERQVPFELQPKYKRHGKTVREIKYLADFVVHYADGHTEVVDVKGFRTDVYKLKKKMLLYKYPDIQFVEISGKTRIDSVTHG